MVRENDNPNANGEFPNFIDNRISCAPLKGDYYESDHRTVHQSLVSFTTGQLSEDWLNDTLRYRYQRISMKALRNHFAGEGKSTRNISEEELLHELLHYKNEISMAFELFLN